VEGQGWVKESELVEKEKAEKTKAVAAAATGRGSKLKNVTNAADPSDGHESDAEGEDDDTAGPPVGTDKKTVVGKAKTNGTMGEGGMMSPESLEA
jgi:hypothetical protein